LVVRGSRAPPWLRMLERTAIPEISRDPGRAKRVISDLRVNAGWQWAYRETGAARSNAILSRRSRRDLYIRSARDRRHRASGQVCVGFENQQAKNGDWFIWLSRDVVDRLPIFGDGQDFQRCDPR
jgi:hypothetical protein